jgi:integration host factor subunit beta
MNKLDLVQLLSSEMEMPLRKTEEIVDKFFDTMSEALTAGNRIEIRGFGTFQVREYQEYAGRNPKTGEETAVLPKKLPFFKAGKDFKLEANVISGESVEMPTLKAPRSQSTTEKTEARQTVKATISNKVRHTTLKTTKPRQVVKLKISPTVLEPAEPPTEVISSTQELTPIPGVQPESRDITHLVERSYDIERSLEINLNGIYAKINSEGQIEVTGELWLTQGNRLPQDLNLVITFHDGMDRIKHSEQVSFNSASLSGTQVFSVQWSGPTCATTLAISKIRIQPGRTTHDVPPPVKDGLIKRILSWIKG